VIENEQNSALNASFGAKGNLDLAHQLEHLSAERFPLIRRKRQGWFGRDSEWRFEIE
jgi:hypothetical protein